MVVETQLSHTLLVIDKTMPAKVFISGICHTNDTDGRLWCDDDLHECLCFERVPTGPDTCSSAVYELATPGMAIYDTLGEPWNDQEIS